MIVSRLWPAVAYMFCRVAMRSLIESAVIQCLVCRLRESRSKFELSVGASHVLFPFLATMRGPFSRQFVDSFLVDVTVLKDLGLSVYAFPLLLLLPMFGASGAVFFPG